MRAAGDLLLLFHRMQEYRTSSNNSSISSHHGWNAEPGLSWAQQVTTSQGAFVGSEL
jgi:hypothetical protein